MGNLKWLTSRRKPMGRYVVLGVDPGKSGGLVLLRPGEIVASTKMLLHPPNLYSWLDKWAKSGCNWGRVYGAVEDVHAFPTDSRRSAYEFGRGVGILQACLELAFPFPMAHATPQRWMRALGIKPRPKGMSKTKWKNMLKDMAQELHPEWPMTLAISDAVLIAEYGALLVERGDLR